MNTCSIFFDLCGGCLISYRLWRSTLWSWKLPRCQSMIFSLQSYVVPFESYRSLIKVKYDLILMSLNMLSVLRFPSVHWLLFLSHLSSWDRRVLLKPRKRYILVFIGRPLSPTELDLKDNDQNPSSSLLSSKKSKADRKSVKNPVESDSAFLLVVCYSLIIWLCPSSSFFFEIGNLIHFFLTLLHTDEGQLVLSPLYLTLKVRNTLPCWLKQTCMPILMRRDQPPLSVRKIPDQT